MANQGVYREAGAAAGLPLPRAHIAALTAVIVTAGPVASIVSLVVFGILGHGAPGAWRIFRNGGWPMWLILLTDLFVPTVIAVLGAFVVRGKRIPAGLLFLSAAAPLVVAIFGAWLGQSITIGAISGESVDPEQKARILAEGVAEAMSNDIFGGIVACGAAIVATLASSSAAASIDAASVSRAGSRPPSFGAIGAAASGALWIVATIALGVLRARSTGPLVFLPVLPLLLFVPFAALAGRGAAVVRDWHDRAEGSRVAGALLVAAISAVLALLALERAIDATFTSQAFEAISGESIDDSQRMRILVYAVDAVHLAPASYAVHAVLGTATFAFALAPAIGPRTLPATPSAIVAVACSVALLGASFALDHWRVALPRAFAEQAQRSAPAGVTLPVTFDALSRKNRGSAYGTRLVITKDGSGDAAAGGSGTFTLYADKAATLGMVRARLPRDSQKVTFVTERKHPADIEARLGYLAGYLGHVGFVAATIDDDVPTERPSDSGVRVVSLADGSIEIDGRRHAFPIADAVEGTGGYERKDRITYVFRPSDTVERAIAVIAGVETFEDRHLTAWDLERTIVVDDGTGSPSTPAPSPRAPSLRQGTPEVNGRLPPEIIQRIVRQNFGRLRLCYENALRRDPTLRGRVTVEFVIDRRGLVTSAKDAGSDLADANVVACVVRTFEALSFPQPEGGTVTVVYPVVFDPGR